jgi:hypothetical protein
MSAKKIMSVCLALALALAAAPAFAAGQVVMDEWNQPVDTSGAKGGAYSGQAELAGSLAPSAHGGSVSKNFDSDEGWVNQNAQGPGGGSSDSNFDKAGDWK